MIIIPALDIRDGQCVRLLYGNYDAETRYDVDPIEQASAYSSMGFSHLHLVDLDGAKGGKPVNTALLKSMIAASGMMVQVGGGIRQTEHIKALMDAGVARVVIGSLAIKEPQRVFDWINTFGTNRIVVALDVRISEEDQTAYVCTDAWTNTSSKSLQATIENYQSAGLEHVLCTDISRDGAMTGPSIELYKRILKQFPAIQLQASGGVASGEDLIALRDAGLPAAITGKALLEGKITAEDIRQC